MEHMKGNLRNGQVRFTFIEEVFEFGRSIFADQDTIQENFQVDASDVTDFLFTEDPWFLTGDTLNIPRHRFAAVDPNSSSDYLLGNASASTTTGPFFFTPFYSVRSSVGILGTTIEITGATNRLDSGTSLTDVLQNRQGNFLCYVETQTGLELIGFQNISFNQIGNRTILSGCIRGLADTYPHEITANDRLWFVDEMEVTTSLPEANTSIEFLPRTQTGRLDPALAANHLQTYDNRHSLPAPAGDVRFGGPQFPTSTTGPLTLSWNHRNRDEQIVNGLVTWDDSSQTLPSDVTYTVRFINNDTGATVEQVTALTDDNYIFDDPASNYNLRVEIETISSIFGSSFQTFTHTTAFTQP